MTACVMRCTSCFHLITKRSKRCEICFELIGGREPDSLTVRVKRMLGIEISAGIITLGLDPPEPFFTDDEIESIVAPEKLKALDATDVPNWEIMFFSSKRVHKPIR